MPRSKTPDPYSRITKKFSALDQSFQHQLFDEHHVPDTLFQYTDIRGLKGILETGKWWATHYQYLNDGKEITYADEMICSYLDKRPEKASPKVRQLLRQIYDEVLSKKYGKPSVIKPFDYDIYLTSFSENGDLLDQWRAYASNGNGYSVGINPRKLYYKFQESLILSRQEEELAFAKVVYDKDKQMQLITSLVDQVEKLIEDEDLIQTEPAARHIGMLLLKLTLIFKDPAFKNEQEWRVIKLRWGRRVMNGIDSNSLSGVSFRAGDNKLIPYLELDFSSRSNRKYIPITEIFLGPKQRNTNAQESLEMFLRSLGYGIDEIKLPDVKVSEIYYQ